MSAPQYNFDADAGSQWQPVFRWATKTLVSKPITAISLAAPAVVTAATHGVPDGWPVAVVGVSGMTQVNADHFPPRGNDWSPATLVDANNVSLDNVSSALYSAYVSGGFLVYRSPVALSGVLSATLTIYDNPAHTGTPLATLAVGTGITLDTTKQTITASLATGALSWSVGYYKLVVNDSGNVPHELVNGVVNILS